MLPPIAGVVQWQDGRQPGFRQRFDSFPPLQISTASGEFEGLVVGTFKAVMQTHPQLAERGVLVALAAAGQEVIARRGPSQRVRPDDTNGCPGVYCSGKSSSPR
jgi:hypothetical protein